MGRAAGAAPLNPIKYQRPQEYRSSWNRGLGAGRSCAGVPKDITGAVASEVADARDLPASARMRAQIDAGSPLAVGDLPLVHITGGWVLPQDVAGAVAGEIADPDDLIARGVCARANAGSPVAVGQFPNVSLDLAIAGVGPKDIVRTVAGEVADAGNLPAAARMRAEIDAGGPLAVGDLPLVHIPSGRVVPKDVAGTIAGEVTNPDDLIAGGVGARADAGSPLAVGQFPDVGLDLTIAGNTGPEDIVGAVAGEVADASDLIVARMCAQIDAAGPSSVGHRPFAHIAGARIVPKNAVRAPTGEITDTGNLITRGVRARAGAGGPLAIR